ncbi:hypothetical protein ACUW9Z_000533 [Aerococcus sp. 150760007-1]|uniref:Uncharacterized protein n=1 Tax=Aerococcus urinaeequi TaxID=51665 RepID=A0AAE9XI28_9LACT|nr:MULTISPECIES: hypothetical protein [Lactobacillales]MBA5746299.1 hypothetical protein [Aerococcus urinaeequi]MBA5829083.1 hypothetical protein [Aerococcus urinaeequi]MBA5860076.1 hypothetical protein [Aerococcus urinaeequi]WCG37718.1 hypothetical protein PML80_09455 [Aerococcus urinaeequi]
MGIENRKSTELEDLFASIVNIDGDGDGDKEKDHQEKDTNNDQTTKDHK